MIGLLEVVACEKRPFEIGDHVLTPEGPGLITRILTMRACECRYVVTVTTTWGARNWRFYARSLRLQYRFETR